MFITALFATAISSIASAVTAAGTSIAAGVTAGATAAGATAAGATAAGAGATAAGATAASAAGATAAGATLTMAAVKGVSKAAMKHLAKEGAVGIAHGAVSGTAKELVGIEDKKGNKATTYIDVITKGAPYACAKNISERATRKVLK